MRTMNAPLTCCLAGLLAVSPPAFAQNKSTAKSKGARPAKGVEHYDASVPKPTLSEVRYGDHERQVLDFWKAKSDSPTPVAFIIHGGGWQNGSKERLQRFADAAALLKTGISVVAINYRFVRQAVELGIEPPVKAPLHDAARALQFVRSKAAEWNLDKERIGAAGGSAGACSSLWLAFHDDLADPKSSDPVARESSRLWCAAVTGPQTSLDPKQMKEWTPNSRYGGHAFGFGNFAEFLAGRDKILPWIKEYSPYALVTADAPDVKHQTPTDYFIATLKTDKRKAAAKSGWIQLFNGKDLTGWTPKIRYQEFGKDPRKTFRVENGILKVSYENYDEFKETFGHLF